MIPHSGMIHNSPNIAISRLQWDSCMHVSSRPRDAAVLQKHSNQVIERCMRLTIRHIAATVGSREQDAGHPLLLT